MTIILGQKVYLLQSYSTSMQLQGNTYFCIYIYKYVTIPNNEHNGCCLLVGGWLHLLHGICFFELVCLSLECTGYQRTVVFSLINTFIMVKHNVSTSNVFHYFQVVIMCFITTKIAAIFIYSTSPPSSHISCQSFS